MLVNDEISLNSKRFYIYMKEGDAEPYAFGFLDRNGNVAENVAEVAETLENKPVK